MTLYQRQLVLHRLIVQASNSLRLVSSGGGIRDCADGNEEFRVGDFVVREVMVKESKPDPAICPKCGHGSYLNHAHICYGK